MYVQGRLCCIVSVHVCAFQKDLTICRGKELCSSAEFKTEQVNVSIVKTGHCN